jgi:5'-nucleotidase
VEYDLNKPNGKRVTKALARCGECRVPIYEPVDPKNSYYVIMPVFVANGGDDFKMLRNNYRREQEMGMFTTYLTYWTLQFLGTASILYGKVQVNWNSTKLKLHS